MNGASTDFQPGQRFGKYTLLAKIAEGGMAEIFLARQAGLEGFEKNVVIKRIRKRYTDDAAFVQMFLNEAKLAAQLNHPNIIQIFDLGRVGQTFFIAMEHVFGRDMRSIPKRASSLGIQFPLEYALRIASNVCAGLHYAHETTDAYGNPLGIVHRDISPENILVSFEGMVKIVDFGIAKATVLVESLEQGQVSGKLSYMSPEQIQGQSLDHRSDLFSLGIVLYEWLTGFQLFTGKTDDDIAEAILSSKIQPPSFYNDHILPAVDAIVMKALEYRPKRRFASAREMELEIDTFLASHEFSPSNLHVGTFIRQLFERDIEDEARRHAEATAFRGESAGVLGRLLGGGQKPARVKEVRPVVHLDLSNDEFGQLKSLAARVGQEPADLAREMVQAFLRYS